MKLSIFVLLAVFLYGCAFSPEEMNKGLDPWIGNDIDALLAKWGTPSSTYQSPTGKIRIYKYIYYGSNQIFLASGQTFSVGTASQEYCAVEFITNANDVITSHRHEGLCILK